MRSIKRSPRLEYLAELRARYTDWDDLDGDSRRRVRDALGRDFGQVCAYCQQVCQPPTLAQKSNEESVDHFRPRDKFPELWLDWLNLVFACRRCNQNKGNRWPGYQDELTNQYLSRLDSRYTPVSEYVNPNLDDGQRPASEFFSFNIETGEMTPSEQLDTEEWSRAYRTIWDIELNDAGVGSNDPSHLWNQRRYQVYLLTEAVEAIEDFDTKVRMMLEFMAPDKPFSGFISAYVAVRFPLFVQLFRQP